MTRELHFVKGAHADRSARRHAMIGKNAGKTVHRRSRRELRPLRRGIVGHDAEQTGAAFQITDSISWCHDDALLGLRGDIKVSYASQQIIRECKRMHARFHQSDETYKEFDGYL